MVQREAAEGFPSRRVYKNAKQEDVCVLRLDGLVELSAAVVVSAENELVKKALLVKVGMDSFSACERVAYSFLMKTF